MYKPNPQFIEPKDVNAKIWRYINYRKFVSMLDTGSLWFSRADKFNDPFEGSSPKINVKARKLPDKLSPADLPLATKLIAQMGEVRRHWVRYVCINCWHMNEQESAAMWDIYLKHDEGMAVQSTFKKYKESFSQNEENIYIGKVNYIDYGHEVLENTDILSPFIHKRKEFEHEKEVRGIIVRLPPHGKRGLDYSVSTVDSGVLVKVYLSTLVEKIYIAPNATSSFIDLVTATLEKYNQKFEVKHSLLYKASPEY
jgi:hypothetical protein